MLRHFYRMKSIFAGFQGFDITTTGMGPYDKLLKDKSLAKKMHVEVKVVKMSPREYLFESGLRVALPPIDQQKVAEFKKEMESGTKFPLPVLHYGEKLMSQDGRHRAVVAQELGINSIPVLIVNSLAGVFEEDLPKGIGIWKRDLTTRNPNGSVRLVDFVTQEHDRIHFDLIRKHYDYHGRPLDEKLQGFGVGDLLDKDIPDEIASVLLKIQDSLS